MTRGVMYRWLVENGEVDLAKVTGPSKDGVSSANGPGVADASEDAPTPAVKTEAETETDRDPVADFVDPVWSGTLVYRALIPKAALDRRWPGHRAGLGPVCVSVFFFFSYMFYFFLFASSLASCQPRQWQTTNHKQVLSATGLKQGLSSLDLSKSS